jgi:hypothetical protein
MNSVPNAKFVIFDISSEYGINLLDLLRTLQSRVVLTEPLRGSDQGDTVRQAEDHQRRHVSPDALADRRDMLLVSIRDLISQDKIRTFTICMDG